MLILNSILNLLSLRSLSQITTVYIHHSVALPTTDISELAQMEQVTQGFVAVGYNAYAKCVDAEKDLWVIQSGRPINYVPAAEYGDNTHGYAICIGGNYHPGGAPFLTQISPNALHAVCAQIALVKAKCPNLRYLQGHRDVAEEMMRLLGVNSYEASVRYGTACPGDNLHARLPELRKTTGLGDRLA